MKKPGTLVAIQVLAWVTIGLTALIYFLTFILLFVKGTPMTPYSDFRTGFFEAGFPGIHLENISRAMGYLFATAAVPIIKYVLVLVFIHKKMFKSLIAMLCILILTDIFMAPLGVIYSLAILIIFLSGIKRIKAYMKPQTVTTNSENTI